MESEEKGRRVSHLLNKVEAVWMAAWTEFQRVGTETRRPLLEAIRETSLKHTPGQED